MKRIIGSLVTFGFSCLLLALAIKGIIQLTSQFDTAECTIDSYYVDSVIKTSVFTRRWTSQVFYLETVSPKLKFEFYRKDQDYSRIVSLLDKNKQNTIKVTHDDYDIVELISNDITIIEHSDFHKKSIATATIGSAGFLLFLSFSILIWRGKLK
ncbi:hypothetical protein [Ekhidna sp. To15]|uniref:hypothetical protein n=1 Tax=Ekhidna sp. To15 TaxID=3395267 RepID=UPI003F523CB0